MADDGGFLSRPDLDLEPEDSTSRRDWPISPGKRTLTAQLTRSAAASPGVPLPAQLLERLEAALPGSSLAEVRVHTGAASNQAAEALGARAYAIGQDIHFAAGLFDPGDPQGEHLIAHEVAHTVQQQGAASAPQASAVDVSEPGDRHELEADAFADAFVAGRATAALAPAPASVARAVIQRDADPANAGAKDDADQCADYAPTFTAPAAVTGKLNDRVSVSMQVSNAEHAPEGATFQFKWPAAAAADRGWEPVTEPAGASASLGLELRKVFKGASIRPTLEMNGKTYDAPAVTVSVEEPTLTWDTMVVHGNNEGERDAGGDPAKIMVNDTYEVSVQVDGVKNPESCPGLTLTGTSNGAALGSAKSAAWSGNTAGITFPTVGPGKGSVEVKVAIPGHDQPTTWKKSVNVSADLTWIRDKAGAVNAKIGARYAKASARLNTAWSAFIKAKDAQDASVAAYANANPQGQGLELAGDLVLGLFFAAAFGGLGGAVGVAVKAGLSSEIAATMVGGFVVDAAKDVVKFGKGSYKALKSSMPAVKEPDGGEPKPDSWGHDMAAKLDEEKGNLLEMVGSLLNKISALPRDTVVDSFEGFDGDPVAALENDPTLAEFASLNTEQTAFARALWATWVDQYAYTVEYRSGIGAENWHVRDAHEEWGDQLAVDIAAQAGTDFGLGARLAIAKQKALADARKRPYTPPGWRASEGGEGGEGSGDE